MSHLSTQELFNTLFNSSTEEEVNTVINKHSEIFKQDNWFPLGGNENNYGIIENQQSNPIAALVEKVTNSMDAVLTKRCLELGIEPESPDAPKSMDTAVDRFFPNNNWDLPTYRRKQSEEIQIVADGPTRESAVIIYDNGEGQKPEDFEKTFLSLVTGNKKKIHFVQGKYNMGGSGAIVFCGKWGYQLIASKRFTGGHFGFTLIREHPLLKSEQESVKNTWYEFLKIDGKIPSFEIRDLDLRLYGRNFKTGTIIKLYSYQMRGIYGFAQELSQSLNEYLFRPVLPFLTVDKKERYPNNNVLESTVFGLQRRLEDDIEYVEDSFSEDYQDRLFGNMKITSYLFRTKQTGKTAKETREDIRKRYFKNGMSVLFSMNGQVHGHYTTEFISKSLQYNMLKDFVLIEVDCTNMEYNFRKKLFMASRDRLKHGDEAIELRDYLKKRLVKSKMDEWNKKRKESIGFESEDTSELIKSFAKNLPKDSDLFKLLQNTIKLEEKKAIINPNHNEKSSKAREDKPFKPERFPTFFRLYNNDKTNKSISVPIGGEKTLKFETDVEDHYFDRTDEPGDLQVSVLTIKKNGTNGGTTNQTQLEPSDLFNIVKSSPNRGTIRITFNPNTELRFGDEIELKASLKGSGENYHDEIVWLKIITPEAPPREKTVTDQNDLENIGLPELMRVTADQWETLESGGITMNHNTVLHTVGEGDKLERIYINLDSVIGN